jgi:DNA mismatch repair ATPase MutS
MVLVGKVRNARKRYVCDHLLTLGKRLYEMERLFKKRMVPVIRDMFVRFYSYREHWSNAVNCIAELDALCSLATYAKQEGMSKPELLDPAISKTDELNINNLRHATVVFNSTSKTFVPNDV